VLNAVGNLVSWLYKLLFSGLDEWSYQNSRRQLIANINDNFAELFSERGGRVHSQEGKRLPKAFDYVSATVEFAEIRFRLVAGRGELAVYIAPSSDPGDWQDLGTLVYGEDRRGGIHSPECVAFLDQTARYIRSHWDELVELYTVENRSVIGQKRTKLSSQLGSP
jgi:hypothetical protein